MFSGVVILVYERDMDLFIKMLNKKGFYSRKGEKYELSDEQHKDLKHQEYLYFRLSGRYVGWATGNDVYRGLEHYTFEEFVKNINKF